MDSSTIADIAAGLDTGETGPRLTTRMLHMVRVDGVEHFYWDLEPALDLLAAEPDADFELITVH